MSVKQDKRQKIINLLSEYPTGATGYALGFALPSLSEKELDLLLEALKDRYEQGRGS